MASKSKKTNSINIANVSKVRGELNCTADAVIELCTNLYERNTDLYSEAKKIISSATEHLKRITNVFQNFDSHDCGHSERIVGYIKDILDDKINQLSSYDIFFIVISAYLHDCGMAVSDREINIMKLIEKSDYDGHELTDVDAEEIIIKHKCCGNNDEYCQEIQNWLFCPKDEPSYLNYLKELIVEYHDFRNTNLEFIRTHQETKDSANSELRKEYLRRTHHLRISKYIEGSKLFDDISFSDRIRENIAKICQSHGEKTTFINDLSKKVSFGNVNSNVQFVAMMLRLGDIADFTKDRASVVLRSLQNFQSRYSFDQWAIKVNCSVTPMIIDHEIRFQADCPTAKDYYNLMGYIDWVDFELKLYDKLNKSWEKPYHDIKIASLVNRSQINPKKFSPSSARLSLDKSRILDLLMGITLYKNKYAFLRELYQNSLDACRVQKSVNKGVQGEISFGMQQEGDNRYVYCLDNGCGMTKDIIENYLLQIGRSYYKSPDFLELHNEEDFTPTSQFGIGILSCFMVSEKIVITTRSTDSGYITCVIESGKEYISCGKERNYDYFYYIDTVRPDREKIQSTGTLIKVYLNEEAGSLNNDFLTEINSMLVNNDQTIEKYPQLKNQWEIWKNNLYKILDDFIMVLPKGINVNVKSGRQSRQIYSKPFVLGKRKGFEDIPISDFNDFFGRLSIKGFKKSIQKDVTDFINEMEIEYESSGIQYKVTQQYLLPNTGYKDIELLSSFSLPVHRMHGCCVDGLFVNIPRDVKTSYLQQMSKYGIVNFVGNNRPQLTIDRISVTDNDFSTYDSIAKTILTNVIRQNIEKIQAIISQHELTPEDSSNASNIGEKEICYYLLWHGFIMRYMSFPEELLTVLLESQLITVFDEKFMRNFNENPKIKNNLTFPYLSVIAVLKKIIGLIENFKAESAQSEKVKLSLQLADERLLGSTYKAIYFYTFFKNAIVVHLQKSNRQVIASLESEVDGESKHVWKGMKCKTVYITEV